MAITLDRNSDMGERCGAFMIGDDAKMLKTLTPAKVVYGFQAAIR